MPEEPNLASKPGKKKALGRGLDALLGGSPHTQPQAAGEAKYRIISISEISPNPDQARKQFPGESLDNLAQSIKTHGLIQPLVVRATSRGYELIAGERRLRAAKIAGLKELPCVISDKEESGRLAAALIENLQREDLNPIDSAEGIRAMRHKLNLTQQEAADALGMSRPAVANLLRLLELSEGVRELVKSGLLLSGSARALLSLKQEQIENAAKYCAENQMSVRQVEAYVRKLQFENTKESGKKEPEFKSDATDKLAEQISLRLTKHFGTKVSIKHGKDGGSIVLKYYSNEDLERLLEAFGLSEDPI